MYDDSEEYNKKLLDSCVKTKNIKKGDCSVRNEFSIYDCFKTNCLKKSDIYTCNNDYNNFLDDFCDTYDPPHPNDQSDKCGAYDNTGNIPFPEKGCYNWDTDLQDCVYESGGHCDYNSCTKCFKNGPSDDHNHPTPPSPPIDCGSCSGMEGLNLDICCEHSNCYGNTCPSGCYYAGEGVGCLPSHKNDNDGAPI
jgi:hypothetical protein